MCKLVCSNTRAVAPGWLAGNMATAREPSVESMERIINSFKKVIQLRVWLVGPSQLGLKFSYGLLPCAGVSFRASISVTSFHISLVGVCCRVRIGCIFSSYLTFSADWILLSPCRVLASSCRCCTNNNGERIRVTASAHELNWLTAGESSGLRCS